MGSSFFGKPLVSLPASKAKPALTIIYAPSTRRETKVPTDKCLPQIGGERSRQQKSHSAWQINRHCQKGETDRRKTETDDTFDGSRYHESSDDDDDGGGINQRSSPGMRSRMAYPDSKSRIGIVRFSFRSQKNLGIPLSSEREKSILAKQWAESSHSLLWVLKNASLRFRTLFGDPMFC